MLSLRTIFPTIDQLLTALIEDLEQETRLNKRLGEDIDLDTQIRRIDLFGQDSEGNLKPTRSPRSKEERIQDEEKRDALSQKNEKAISALYADHRVISLLTTLSLDSRELVYIQIERHNSFPISKKTKTIQKVIRFYDKMKWPLQKSKDLILTEMACFLLRGAFETQKGEISINGMSFSTHSAFLNPLPIFGTGNHLKTVMSHYVALGIRKCLLEISSKLANHIERYSLETLSSLKIPCALELCIGQYAEIRISAKTIKPLLPHLEHIPGLVNLKITDIGLGGDSKKGTFDDKDVKALTRIFDTNKHLLVIRINVRNMSEKAQKELITSDKKHLS